MSETKYDILAQPKNEMKFSYGGQAVIEGVMMRGAHIFAVAVRAPDGEIVVHQAELNKHLYRGRIARMPFVRGLVGLWDSLGLGTRALMWSADVALDEEAENDNTPKNPPANPLSTLTHMMTNILLMPFGMFSAVGDTPQGGGGGKSIDFNGPIGWATVAFSMILGLALFMVLPNAAATFLAGLAGIESLLVINLIEGVIQLAILIGYIYIIGLMPDTRRLFGYHGAEHKTINAYEAGDELIPEVVANYPIEHPRCGTAFLLTVSFIGMLVFAVVDATVGRLLITRVLLIPVVAGIAYEVLRYTARNINNPLVRLMVTPNLALQHLTTRTPDLTMIEVAIVAFKHVLVSEGVVTAEEAGITPKTAAEPVSATASMTGGD